MDWQIIRNKIEIGLLERNLKNPKIRINALKSIEKLIEQYNPEILKNPLNEIRTIEKNILKENLSKYKVNLKLNSAESSIINEIYYLI